MSADPTDKVVNAINEAIERAGGVSHLGAIVGVAHSSVIGWRQERRIPARHVLPIEQATGISRHRLRPDLYPESPSGFAEAQATFTPAPSSLAAEARALGLDPEAIAAKALADAVRAEKGRRWLEENRDAIEAHNRWVEQHGVPLAEYRMF